MTLHPDNRATGLYERGYFYEQLNQNEKAIADYKQFLELEEEGLESFKKEVQERLENIKTK